MSEPKPHASLSPALLARKGGARPAMRQAFNVLPVAMIASDHDDLGWNDMGGAEDPVPVVSAQVHALHQASPLPPAVLPEVVRQQRALPRQVAVQHERRSALAEGRRAAFTLRLDAERHLQLRLACTIQGCSAQALVTAALDRLLADIPDATEIASKLATRRA